MSATLNLFTQRCEAKHGKKATATIIQSREGESPEPWKNVLVKTGVNHSLAELVDFEAQGRRAGLSPLAATPENVVWCRTERKLSWGLIAAWCQIPESKVRTLFKGLKGEHSDAQRIGKGGRWKFNDPELYTGDLKPTGTVIPADQKLLREVAEVNATQQRLMKLSPAELKAEAEKAGVKVTKGWTRGKIIVETAKALKPSQVKVS